MCGCVCEGEWLCVRACVCVGVWVRACVRACVCVYGRVCVYVCVHATDVCGGGSNKVANGGSARLGGIVRAQLWADPCRVYVRVRVSG